MGKFANYFNMPPTLLGGLFQWPRHGQGEGPDGYKLFAEQMTQETLGGAGVERSGTKSPGHPIALPF